MKLISKIEDVLLEKGYTKSGYGYKKETKEIVHWITVFEDKVQMYAYLIEDPDFDKIYDTGCVIVNSFQLSVFIDVFLTNDIDVLIP